MQNVVIIDALRTPLGSFGGKFKFITAPDLGSVVIGALFKNNSLNPDIIDEVIMGNALSAGIGQAPARQAALKAGLKNTTPCTTVNKVCASGMKAVMIAMQQIASGDTNVMIAGGMESMSNVPYYHPETRFGIKLGHSELQDGIMRDGLWDAYKNYPMSKAAELCASTYGITREEQDEYTVTSYRRAQKARDRHLFKNEITPVKIRNRKGDADVIISDEELDRVILDNIAKATPVFGDEGTITLANASPISDGAAALLLMSEKMADEHGLKPAARLVSQSSTAQAPEWFTTAPAEAVSRALHRAGKKSSDMDLFEINEAFSVVTLANNRLLKLDPEKVNVHGGAVSLGHPLGCSGSRILVTLIHALHHHDKTWGCAAISNGGGGASAMVVERLS
ncbi:MAG: acetyl-CoA C-acyltransferase [Balneolales bacterium]